MEGGGDLVKASQEVGGKKHPVPDATLLPRSTTRLYIYNLYMVHKNIVTRMNTHTWTQADRHIAHKSTRLHVQKLHTHTHTHTHESTHARTHTHIHTHTHACTHTHYRYTNTHVRTHARTHARTHILPLLLRVSGWWTECLVLPPVLTVSGLWDQCLVLRSRRNKRPTSSTHAG